MVRIGPGQMDPVLGEVDGEPCTRARAGPRRASRGADLVVFPSWRCTGMPWARWPRTVVTRRRRAALALTEAGPEVLVGFHEDGGVRRYNSAAYLSRNRARKCIANCICQLSGMGGAEAR